MKWFGKEPALILTAALGLIQLFAVLAHMDHDHQNALSVGATAVFGIALAAFTRPIQPAALTGGIATLATSVGVLGFEVSPDIVSAFNTALVGFLVLTLTNRVSPSPALAARSGK